MKTTTYFDRRKQDHGVTLEHVIEALQNEVAREVQEDGRMRIWGYVDAFGKYLRVVLLPDGETVHNAFPDRTFTRRWRAS